MPVRHLVVWLAAGAACWSLIAVAAYWAPEALLALGALVLLPWLRSPRLVTEAGAVEPVLLRSPAPGAATRNDSRVLVAQSA